VRARAAAALTALALLILPAAGYGGEVTSYALSISSSSEAVGSAMVGSYRLEAHIEPHSKASDRIAAVSPGGDYALWRPASTDDRCCCAYLPRQWKGSPSASGQQALEGCTAAGSAASRQPHRVARDRE
jgi:hypothetical protein